jgi:polyisoprenoid-binding protein YceI
MKARFSTLLTGASALSFLVHGIAFASAQKVDFDQATGSTAFHAVGRPSAIKINGTGAAPKGALLLTSDGKVSGNVLLDLSTLDTGISMRTNHMKEKYLEVEKFPKALLAITEVGLPKADVAKTEYVDEKIPFKGNLTLHGVTKPVEGIARIERHGQSSTVHAEFTIKIDDYAIAIPVFAGITVADDVSLVIDAVAPIADQK